MGETTAYSEGQMGIHVVGIGLDGAAGLTSATQAVVEQATLLVGSPRHLGYFPNHPAERLELGDLTAGLQALKDRVESGRSRQVVILVSGDPLFFGLGRLLLTTFPRDGLTFHPHLSSVQLAFSRVKLPWQAAKILSAHGRSLETLTQALQQGTETIAILTDGIHNPGAIAQVVSELDLPGQYRLWVCEDLGGETERVRSWLLSTPRSLDALQSESFAPLNVVVLHRETQTEALAVETLPLLGLPDQTFLSFGDRPGLMTKREVRTLVLAELALQPEQMIWDVGAGTGSVAIEMARLCPTSQVYAIEKTAAGWGLIQQNCQRLQVTNVQAIQGAAPESLQPLPRPDRIFVGGSGGALEEILQVCGDRLKPAGVIVLALATLEHLNTALTWVQTQNWSYHLLQVQLSRSTAINHLTRFSPLNPVTLLTLEKPD